jgi:hypothetical protein
MKVTFSKSDAGRSAPPISPRVLSDDAYLPIELAQFVIEAHFGITRGVYGQLATSPAPRARSAREHRAARRNADTTRADLARSERLLALCLPLWQLRAGRVPSAPAMIDMTLATPFDVDDVLHRLDALSAEWRALAIGESITLEWSVETLAPVPA